MDLNTLKIFRTVAQVGSISKAASILHYVQSNVSARIRKLEEQLDSPLFIRESRGIRLTLAGETLYSYADQIIKLEEEAVQAVSSSNQGKGLLRIGAMESTLAIRLPDVLHKFVSQHPEIALDIHTGTTDKLIDAIFNYRVDGAFVAGDICNPSISSEYVFTEEIVLITPGNIQNLTNWASKKLIVFRQGCAYRSFGEQWMRENGYSPVHIMELGTLDGIMACVAAGIGISFFPRSLVENHMSYKIVNVHTINENENAMVNINLYRNADVQPHPALKWLVDLLP